MRCWIRRFQAEVKETDMDVVKEDTWTAGGTQGDAKVSKRNV